MIKTLQKPTGEPTIIDDIVHVRLDVTMTLEDYEKTECFELESVRKSEYHD